MTPDKPSPSANNGDAAKAPPTPTQAGAGDAQRAIEGNAAISVRQDMVSLREELMLAREETGNLRDTTLRQREHVAGGRETKLASREKSADEVEAIGAVLDVQMNRLREANQHLVITAVEAQIMAEQAQTLRDQIDHRAHHDGLTGLPNRAMLMARLSQAIAVAKRHKTRIAVMFIDLDRFKAINDSLGHAVGDSMLQMVAQRLQGAIRDSDTVSRHGGDEFVIVLPEVGGKGAIEATANKICATVAAPYFLVEQDLRIGVTIGISIYPNDGDNAETLIQNADVAMYDAKEAGRNRCHFFAPQMNERALVRLRVESELHRALERQEFELHYQPLVDLRTGAIVTVEALIRWRHPARGVLDPVSFLPIAETCGVIKPIGTWVLGEACRQIKCWHDQGLASPVIAVNVSALQFQVADFAAMVGQTLYDYAVDPKLLALELTETVLMDDVESTLSILRRLKSIGIRIAIDDFGTGYSSLAYLRRFPIDELKIDISFIHDITTNADDAAIVLAVISMAHSLKLHVIAEGVETEAQLNYLRRHRCDQIQGYYFSRPLGAAQLTELLRHKIHLASQAGTGLADKTLLILDDDPRVVGMLSDLFEGEGYQVLSAYSAAEAFTLLALNRVHVVLCDQSITGAGGEGFFDQVKELHPNTFRIVLTGYTDPVSLSEAVKRGAAFRFYSKPWDKKALREIVWEAFRQLAQPIGVEGASARPAESNLH
ncbi:MAG: EAL domain-containing protein [Pseudomonadota bacterium]